MGPQQLAPLVTDLMPPLVLYARQWCTAAEDVVQEAFVRLAAQRQTPDQPRAWLYRVVRNGAISAGRAEKRRQRHENQAAAARPGWFVPCSGETLDVEAVTAALERLPADQREALVLHLWGGLTFVQVGTLMSASSSTVHRYYLQGLECLRERLGVTCPPKN
jgi:RNA polymerase sigma-70 factor (ECF subfamily)